MLKYLLGWKTSRKIVVIESDDWGSFRFKNTQLRDKYLKNPEPHNWMSYNDCFESFEDLKALSKVLKNNNACITFLLNPANPDFKKIESSNFTKYYSETFLETISKRDDGAQIYAWYKESKKKQIIEIAFHGREHLNVNAWMADLNKANSSARKAFDNKVWGQSITDNYKPKISHRSTFNIAKINELKSLKSNISQGISLINEMFSQNTTYFLPPDGPYHLNLNSGLVENGIKYLGLAKLHSNPLDNKLYQKKIFWLGKKTKESLTVITRNVIFEPSSPKSQDWVGVAMQGIEKAFRYKNPAVISTHRANYTGSLNFSNRINGLEKLENLLNKIQSKWPDAIFMTSSQLGDRIRNN